ncbi:hypothetical protein BDV96DRAFT_687454 [Lophiotrema nucula]|uniref:Uncharacterized protein n=1 Tax=Lophiotrema nucula TaxID=690887 RepID=A0A6A5Z8B3_9PLEO|nr:hypothetical protein BDV96DRAFT_687454 [Lophiotrema nucula]
MIPTRSRPPQYRGYTDDIAINYRDVRQRSARDSSLYGGDFDDRPNKLRSRQLTWSGKSQYFDVTIGKLLVTLPEATAQFREFNDRFNSEIEHVRRYADTSMIDTLWEIRLDLKPKSARRGSRKEEEEDIAVMEEYWNTSRQLRRAWVRLERALMVTSEGTNATVSPERRAVKEAEDKSSIERTVPKLKISSSQCLDLLTQARKKYSQFEPLLKELNFLGQIVKEWTVFTSAGGDIDDDEDREDD